MYDEPHTFGFRWQHASFGTNWRLTEVQSAIGRKQLAKLRDWSAARRRNGFRLSQCFQSVRGLRAPLPATDMEHAFYKCYAFVEPEALKGGWDRDRIARAIQESGVPCSTGSCSEIYLEGAFPPEWRPAERLRVAKELGETSLMFQVHPTLNDEHIQFVCEVVKQVMTEATGSRP